MTTKSSWRIAVALVAVVALCSCSKKQDQQLFPAGQPMAGPIRFEYAVYLPSETARDFMPVLRELVMNKHPELKLVPELPKEPRDVFVQARVEKDVRQEYAPPDLETLRHSGNGLSKEQEQALQKCTRALIIDFAHPKERVWVGLRSANVLIEEIARKTGGFIWDEETREVFSPDAWHQKRLASWKADVPKVSAQTVIHVYQNGEYARAVTLGMSKMGLPDVVVENSPWASTNQVGNLINDFCQAMAEGGAFTASGMFKLDIKRIKEAAVRSDELESLKANATGIACLTLKQGKWEEGDAQNRLIELGADQYPGGELQQKQEAMLSSFFGSEDFATAAEHNEELLAASEKARAKLPELRRAFNAGLQPGEYIQIKAPFRTAEGNEWMWVEIVSWQGNQIKGALQNDPVVATYLRSGQTVTVQEEDVFDYMRTYPDNRIEGNSTGDIIKKTSGGERKPSSSSGRIPTACTGS